MDWIFQYSLFLMKSITVVIAIVAVLLFIFIQKRRNSSSGELEVNDLTERYQQTKEKMQAVILSEDEFKCWQKKKKQQDKAEAKQKKQQKKKGEQGESKPHLFVLSFDGSMDAHEVENLRQEITAVLSIAQPGDEALIKLESPGGVVHGYGLAASQLARFREHNIPLTAAVDKVAASGGYMMACVANKIVAAPFAILGSIGVVAQIPNIHRLLKKNDIDVEMHTAGEYKRTLTMLGENTEEGRAKFKQELDETHQLFKGFVHQYRPALDINSVATGEHWFALQAKDKGLLDEITTSDDLIISKLDSYKVLSVKFVKRKKLVERISENSMLAVDNLLVKWWFRGQKPQL